MAKKKKLLTAEEYKQKHGLIMTAEQYKNKQAAEKLRKQEAEKAAVNAQSKQMTNSWKKMSQDETYSGGRTAGNTFGTYALKQQYDRSKNKKTFFEDYMNELAQKRTEANRKLTQDATYMMDGKGDPGIAYRSVMQKADSDDARKKLNKYAQEEKQFNLDVQHIKNEKLAKGDYSDIDFGTHMGKYTDDLKETFYLPNVSTRNIDAAEQRKRGYGNSGTDWSTYSDNDALQKKKDEYIAQRDKYKNRHTDPYEALEEKGQLTPVYSSWGESEGTQEAAKKFHQSIKGRDKDDINPQTIMDSIYGSGTYSYETQGMTDIERRNLDDDIMNRFYQMERPEGVDVYGQMEQEQKTNEDMIRYADDQIKNIDRQMAWNDEYNALMSAETGGDRAYHPENDYDSENDIHKAIQAGAGDVDRFDALYNMTSPSVDVISSFINRGVVYDDWMKVSGRLPDGMKNVAHMLPEEIGKFNEYYNAGRKDEAMAFIEGLQHALGQRNQYYENVQKKYETTQAPVLSYLNTFTEKAVLQPAEMLGVIAGRIFGDKRVEDPDSGYWAITNDINKTRQFVTEDMDRITRFFVETGTSAVDSFMNVLMGNSLGLSDKALEYTVLGFFGTQAFQTSMNENLRETNGDWAHSFAEATIDTLIETATEIFSVEKLLSDPKKFLDYLFKNAIAEGSEEFVGATFGPLVHEMLMHENEWRDRAAQIWRDGGYTDGNGNFVKVGSEEEAYRQAMKEWNHDIFRSTLSGALSTGGAAMVGGVQNVGNRLFGQYQEAGKQIRNAETAGKSGTDVLLDAAASMKEGTKSNKQANKIKEKIKAGEKVSDFEIGKLANNIFKESNKQAAEAARTVIEDNAFEKLEKTKLSVVQSREMARIISEAVMKGGVDQLSKKDRSTLVGSIEGFNVYKDYISFKDETKNSETINEVMGQIIDATQKTAEAQASVSELLDDRRRQATEEAEDPGEQLATEEEIRNATGAAVTGARGAIVNGEWAKLGNLVKVKEKDADGNEKTVLRWQIEGTDKTVRASEIKAADFSTATIIRQAAVNPGMFSNGFVNTLMQANDQGQIKNVGRFLLDAQKIRIAGYIGLQLPANTIGSKAAQTIYDQAKYEHGKNRDAQVKDGNAGKIGKITFMGAEYGTEAFTEAVKKANLNKNQIAQIDAIAGIAQRAGIEVYFRSAAEVAKEWGTSDPEMTYGWESNTDEHGRGISVNIEGLDFQLGEDGNPEVQGQHNMLVTFGHEMTHWLQRNSMQGYNSLESFVMGEMRRNGVNIQRRVMDVMNRLNLSIEDAVSEIVADACDQILANEEVRDHIQETDKGLFKEIKNFVTDLVGRVKAAIKGMDQSASRDARAMMRSANRLAKVWMGAYDEAISGEIKRGEGTDTTRLSEADFSYETLIKKPDMVVYTLNELSDKEYQEDLSKNTRDFAKDIIEEVKQENDGKPEINNIDTGKDIQITVESIKHSIGRELQKNYALICHNMTKILENAVAVNELNGRRPKSNYSTLLIGAYNTKDAFTAVRFNVNNRTWKADSFEILYSITKNEIKKEGPVNMTPGLQAVMPDSGSPSFKVSISDLLDIVKNADEIAAVVSKDVADELGIKRKYIKGLSEDLRYSQADLPEQKNIEGGSGISTVDDIDKVESDTPSTRSIIGDGLLDVNRDREYQEAVERGDLKAATDMLMEKLERTKGITAFKAPQWDAGKSREVARLMKKGNTEAISKAAAEMADLVPDNAVLIPMPGRSGVVADDSWTMQLANAISELTGRPVVNALEGVEHESRQEAKARGELGASQEELGFHQVAEIPEGTFPIFIDNVVGKGITADAAKQAMGGGMTLAYTKTLRSPGIVGLKNAIITYDKNGNLIPLSQRFDVSKRDVRFSKAITDEEADNALKESGEISSEPVRYSYAGINAQGGFAGYVEEAMRMDKEGVPEKEIAEKTGCIKGYNGRWWKVLDRDKMHFRLARGFNLDNYTVESMRLEQIYDARELYEAYPWLKNALIRFKDLPSNEWGSAGGTKYNPAIEINKKLVSYDNSAQIIEGVLQHELQHVIQMIEGSNSGANPTFWKDMQDVAKARMYTNSRYLDEIYKKYGIDNSKELAFGLEFKDDGTLDEEWLFPEELEKVKKISDEDLERIRLINKDTDKWTKILKGGRTPVSLYRDTVGEIEARAVEERTGESQWYGIYYGPDAVTTEEYTGRNTRFSKYTHDNMDVEEWMSKAKPWNLVTEDERELLDKYNGLRTRRGLLTKTVVDLKSDIKRKESILDKLTPDELKDLEKARAKLEEKQAQLLETEDKMFEVTSAEGYAGMMYRNNVVLNDWILGKTQDDVRESVEQMVDQVKASEKAIAAKVKALRKLADSQAVKAVSSMVEKKSLNYAVTSLKKQLNSGMGKTELESRLIEMALKKANGEDIQEDARLLAIDLTNQMRGYQLDTMERMRGVKITIGPDQQAEMKGNGMTLKDVQNRLKGTGIKVEYGERSSLDTDTQEGGDLRTLLPELPQEISENSADALFRFIDWAEDTRNKELELRQSMVDIEDETMNVLAIASSIKVNLDSPEYRKMNEAAAKTRQAADELEQTGKTMSEQTELAGKRAVGFTSILQRDVHQAIEYYNKVAKVAAQEEKNKVRKNLIEELKSENTRKLMEQRDKYEQMMKADRKNRELAEDNMQIRNRINTVASRISKRLTAETDMKNIPQEAKPLARQVLKMLINHDMVYRHVLFADKKQRTATLQALNAYDMRDGMFNMDRDLNWLIVGQGENADYDIYDKVIQDLIDIETGLMNYRNAEGQKGVTLMDRKEALKKIDDAVSEIWSVIRAREEANFNGKRMLISEMALQARDDMAKSRFKGEWTGIVGHGLGAVRGGVIYGNMTPEYFFKNLRNKTISQLYDEYHRAENRNGLEVGKAQKRIAEIAEMYGYSTWDQKKRYTFKLVKGGTVNLTLGEMMSLYATWEREEANRAEVNGPEESFHLNVGGFYTVQEEQHKILGREIFEQKAHRLTEADMTEIKAQMTEEQLDYVRDIVEYITKDIGALGNEASMRMYGIKKYNEQWYFPFEIWEGVKSKKSDQGASGSTENRIGHMSASHRRVANASNALVIRDFTETAVKHIAGMINYNTFAPAIEFMNRVMNTQLDEFGEGEDSNTKRNLRAIIGEIYGKDAVKYLDDFQKDINGGVTRADRTIYDSLLSIFKKNAVAGSMSVAMQQPLSYIRAAMMINPKYLAAALNPEYYKGSLAEMEKYSGVAVIKRMGKFDMNFGRSAQEFMMPDAKVSKREAVTNWIGDKTTILPELMDRATWTRMWTACKLEQAALNPGVDMKSDAFLEKVAERFNDVMRKTQVYDSVLVKSRNMRSTNPYMKAVTSFMSEPTLTANVLADAVGEVLAREKGGRAKLAKAGATFILGAILQAIVKGVVGAGRSPDDKKTFLENAAYKFTSNLIGEVNPMSLIPGYNDIMETLIKGELKDDAMGVVAKIFGTVETAGKVIRGETDLYRGVEDSVGQLTQLFTNVPAKNLMRDARAMWNYIVAQPYAKRENSKDVLYYQLMDLLHNSQNLTGLINQKVLGDKGWETKNEAYYKRIYAADAAGKKEKVAAMIEYLKLARNTKEEAVNTGIRTQIKKDKSLTQQQKIDRQKDWGLTSVNNYISTEYKEGRITRAEAEKLYRKQNQKATDKDVAEAFDGIDWNKDEKELPEGQKNYSNYTPLYQAIADNSQAEIRKAIKKMETLGYKKENIKTQLGNMYKKQYIAATVAERGKMQTRLIKAYNEVGVSSAEAMEIMQKWVMDASKSSK